MSPILLRRPLMVISRRRPKLMVPVLVASAIAGGCSRDALIVGVEANPESTVAALAVVVAAPAPRVDAGDAVDDVLTRLVPSFGNWAAPLRDALLRLQERKKDETAWTNVQRVIEAVSTNLPEEYRPDLDALRLELGIAFSQ